MLLALASSSSGEGRRRKSSQAVQNSRFSSLNSDLRNTQKAVLPPAGEERRRFARQLVPAELIPPAMAAAFVVMLRKRRAKDAYIYC